MSIQSPDTARRAELLQRLSSTRPMAPTQASGSRTPRWPLAAGATLLMLALPALWLAPRTQAGQAQAAAAPLVSAAPRAPTVAPVVIDQQAGVAQLEASGYIAATRMATVSARTMGLVTEMLVDEGTPVRRGQILARLGDGQALIDHRLAQAQQAAAQARVASASAQLREVEREVERERSLRDQGYTSDARLGKAQTAVETAQAALASARAELALTELQVQRQAQSIEDHVVRAPFDGVVLARNAQVGEMVAPGGAGGGFTRTGICTLVDMGSLEIVVDVNEEMLTRVRPGQPVRAELYSHKGLPLQGEVLRIMANADRAKATVRTRIRLHTQDPRILPDMAVKVFFL